MPTVVDLFCGSGGTSCGFRSAGFTPVCAVDMDADALETYAANFPNAECIEGDIKSAKVKRQLLDNYSGVDCVIMCPPCQAFSKRNLTEDKEFDAKNELPFIAARLVRQMKPKAVFMEEVAQCEKIAPKIAKIFEAAGYEVQYTVLYASDFQVPQHRKRFILVATSDGVKFTPPNPKPSISVKEALQKSPMPQKGPQVSDQTKEKILRLQKQGTRLIGGNYSLMDTSKPAPTIHTQSLSATGPYTIKRGNKYHSLSTEEAARLQSYPSSFKFRGTETSIRRQIGNSVPPMLAKNIARGLKFSSYSKTTL